MASRASLHMLWMWELRCQARLRLTAALIVSCSRPLRSSAKRMAWGFFWERRNILRFSTAYNQLKNFHSSTPPCHTCLRRAMDSLGMISLRLRRDTKHRAWYWFCPRSSSPRISARNIFTSWKSQRDEKWKGWTDDSRKVSGVVREARLW